MNDLNASTSFNASSSEPSDTFAPASFKEDSDCLTPLGSNIALGILVELSRRIVAKLVVGRKKLQAPVFGHTIKRSAQHAQQ
jgi:hypothetical protein